MKKTDKKTFENTLGYRSWKSLKNRCYNSNGKNYDLYGGRGVTVCDRWKNSFPNFIEDMGEQPFKGAQIDRINSDGNYEPSNCRWVTSAENNQNRRNNKLKSQDVLTIKASNEKNAVMAKKFNVSVSLISQIRLNKKWAA